MKRVNGQKILDYFRGKAQSKMPARVLNTLLITCLQVDMMSTLNFCVNEIKDDVNAIEIMNGWV